MKKIASTRVKKALKFLKSHASIYRVIDHMEMYDFVEFECERVDEVIIYRVYDNTGKMELVIH
jgi:hypothetical protein